MSERFRNTAIQVSLYLIGGLCLGAADRLLGQVIQQFGVRPGMATYVSVNLLLPMLAIRLGMAHRRVAIAWLGAVGMTAAYVAGLAISYPPPQPWGIGVFLAAIPPILVLACIGYAIVGTITVLVVRRVAPPG